MTHHDLPGFGPNAEWFGRLNRFEAQETVRQVQFKDSRWPGLPHGCWSKDQTHTYPHILPDGEFGKALYQHIAQAVQKYCAQESIAWHSEALNLRSSQVCCFNVLFPLRQDLELAAAVLSPLLPSVRRVTAVEFEYTGDSGATTYLGEPSNGGRGQNRTSIDVAIWWEDASKSHLTLCEWKYTERSFGPCGGHKSDGNPDPENCSRLNPSVPSSWAMCYLTAPRHHRNYWAHMAQAGVNLASFNQADGCPFKGPFYQVMRQFLLAAYLRQHGDDNDVDVAVIAFKGNDREVGYSGTVQEWNQHLVGVPPLRLVYVDDIVASIRAHATGPHEAYLRDRYGV